MLLVSIPSCHACTRCVFEIIGIRSARMLRVRKRKRGLAMRFTNKCISQLKMERSGYFCSFGLPALELSRSKVRPAFLSPLQEWQLEAAKDPFMFRAGRPRGEQPAGFSVSGSLTTRKTSICRTCCKTTSDCTSVLECLHGDM